ncbi:hypothetical protein Tco_0593705 [Tanacetum coccineum]
MSWYKKKKNMMLFKVDFEKANDTVFFLASGCGSGSIPFSCLGLPNGANMHLTANWQPLIDRFRAKLSTWKANTLSIGGRLTLIKLGGSRKKKKMAWFKWENVLASFDKDSLWARVIKAIHGVEVGLDLKGCNCNGVWSFIISSYAMLHERNILSINTLCHKAGDGSSIRFWKDNWNGNGPSMSRFNRLCHLDVDVDCLLSFRRINDAWV